MVEGIGESDVPLTQDIVKREKEFDQTFLEFIFRTGTERFFTGEVVNAADVIYTVPENKTAYLVEVHICKDSTGAGTGHVAVGQNGSLQTYFIASRITDAAETNIQLAFPILMQQGQTIEVNSNDLTLGVIGSVRVIEIDKGIVFTK